MKHLGAFTKWALFLIGIVTPALSQHLTYYGGPIIGSPQVVVVLWGPNVNPAVSQNMPGFYQAILNSAYWQSLREYNTFGLNGAADGIPGSNQFPDPGSYSASFTISPSICSANCQITTDQISQELQTQITNGNLPAAVQDSGGYDQTIYMVYFPLGVTIADSSGGLSCQTFLTTATGVTSSNLSGGQKAPVGIFPDAVSSSSP